MSRPTIKLNAEMIALSTPSQSNRFEVKLCGICLMDGIFAIDVKTRKDPWRIIIQPLDENEEPYDPCNIDEIAGVVRIVEVKEVSNHYE